MGVEAKSYWNVLYTRPRAEKKAAMELAALGAQVYCPTLEVLSQWSDRKKRIQKPALPSMVLVKEDTPDRILFSSAGASILAFWTWRSDRYFKAID